MNSPEDANTGPVIRDLRRIDPVTGQVRDPGSQGRRDGDPRVPGKSRPGRHAASKPGGAGSRPAAGQPGSAPGAQPPGARPQPPAGGQGSDSEAPGRPGGTPPAGPPGDHGGQAADAALTLALAERTADLQRIQAEYANYRKRVERDRVAVREQALANVLSALLPVLDDIGRAREHGELTGGFKSVGESLETTAAKLGLQSFGDAGEPFDPRVHEALMHSYSAEVTEPTAVQILQPGYKVGDRIIRPARVAVAEPTGGPGPDEDEASAADDGSQQEPGQPRGNPPGNH